MKFKKIIALCMASALVLTGCGKTSADDSSESQYLGNSNGNINNLGSIASDDNYVYYQNGEDGYKLYKSSLSGSGEEKLNDSETYFINSYNDKIYYADQADGFSIYSMNQDGSDKKRIIEAPAYYVTVYKDNIYYVDIDNNSQVFKADLDGQNITKIIDDTAFYITCYGNKLYYVNLSDGAKIYSADLDGQNKKCVVNEYSGYPVIYNDMIYYTQPKNTQTKSGNDFVYRYSLLDGTTELVIGTASSELNAYKGKLYFKNLDSSNICSYDLETEEIQTVVTDENPLYVNIANDTLFYISKTEDGKQSLKSKEL